MARQPRIEYQGAFYHVTSRGNLKQNIFFDDADRKKLLEILKRIKARYSYILHAYALMDNHYHFLIETPLANLNQVMHNINTSYTVYINKRHDRSGHLFQGRYKAILVEKDSYLLSLSRYTHLNPVRAGIVYRPEEYQWSSYREFIGYPGPGVVHTADALSYFSENKKAAVMGYRTFVESGIGESHSPFEHVQAGIVLGGESFVEEKVEQAIGNKSNDRDLPALRKLMRRPPIEGVVKAVADYYVLSPRDLTRRSVKHSRERKLAIYLSKIMTRERHHLVGGYFGITPQAVANVLAEVENSLIESKEMRKELDEIKCRL